jgi:tetrahydromethanopterin S-methyltransferase subunit G
MPLSEQEQRLLDEMERSLYHNDADDVSSVGGRRGRAGGAAILLGILGLVVGVALLLVGVAVRVPIIGVVGFVAMFAGAVVMIAPPRRLSVLSGRAPRARAPRASFMDNLGERWERRNDDDER